MYFINTRLDQKELFFDLKSKLNMGDCSHGWYVIFKDDICLYVGQSKNLPSRIATHLKGKYNTADKILIYQSYGDIKDELLLTEQLLMQIFKPIENILVDYSKDIDTDELSESLIIYELEYLKEISKDNYENTYSRLLNNFNYQIILDKKDGILVSGDLPAMLYDMPKSIRYISETIKIINDCKKDN